MMSIDWGAPPARILRLLDDLDALNIDHQYREVLEETVFLYPIALLSRPEIPGNMGWSDLEALQQLTLANAMERRLRRKFAEHTESMPLNTGDINE